MMICNNQKTVQIILEISLVELQTGLDILHANVVLYNLSCLNFVFGDKKVVF